jgi:hypothetical protein
VAAQNNPKGDYAGVKNGCIYDSFYDIIAGYDAEKSRKENNNRKQL